MRLTKIRNFYQLTFLPKFFPVNCYLVEEAHSLTLVDCALPFSADKILEIAKQIGKPIRHIVITHAHKDHVGALDQLKQRIPEAQVMISKRDSRLLKGDRSLDSDEVQTPIRGSVPHDVQTNPDSLLQEGDQIGSLRVIATPGHTPGSISLLDERDRSLIVGDAFQVRGVLQ